VKWTRGTQNDDVVDVRGRSAGGTAMRLGGGGVATVIVVVLVARLFGVDISGLLGGGGGGGGGTTSQSSQPEPPKGTDPDAELVSFIRFVITDIQDTFQKQYKAEGRTFRRAKLLVFRDTIDTGCGRSSAAIGPFYCPADEQAYIDLSFYRALKQRFGAPGDFAQAYVLAHEIGHHLQKVNGLEQEVARISRDKRSRNAASVRQELQADCFAGVWGHSANARQLLEMGDLEEAIGAATAIGDDRLQRESGRNVNPETFTHGTSEQRVKWFRRGFETGRFDACNTFAEEP
jgi:uncharacterized protein